jgi:pimeloyl-ACP methyl ester carboxylesterase
MVLRPSAMLVRCLLFYVLLWGFAMPAWRGRAESGQSNRGDPKLAYRLLGRKGPVIVFESGQGVGKESWDRVAQPLAACARVLLYDREGIGDSPAPPNDRPVMADAVTDELAGLLRAISVKPPYLLVGHSLGGLYVQSFARRYPKEVAAVVLVDASSPLEPPGVFVSTAPHPAGSISAAEEAGVPSSMAALLEGPPFPPVPLIVLAATDHGDTPQREALWREVQSRTAGLSPKGRLEVIDHSGHFIQQEQPEAIVRAVLEAARLSGLKLTGCR